jgi:hypothetical protein
MDIPVLSAAQKSIWFYHRHVVTLEAAPGDLAGLADIRTSCGAVTTHARPRQ